MSDKPWEERFRRKVGPLLPSGCRHWQGKPNAYGYGAFTIKYGLVRGAHRIAWELENGPIPDGLHVLHHCDNPICVNVDHLYLGTPKDNAGDRERRNRSNRNPPRGEQHTKAKLTEQAVQYIRANGVKGRGHHRPGTVQNLADRFGVSDNTILAVINGRTWTHVA